MTDTPDTSAEAVETLRHLIQHNLQWHGLEQIDRDTYRDADAMLAALAAERDALRAAVERLRIEMDAAERFGGGWFADVVSEGTREVYREKARAAQAMGCKGGKARADAMTPEQRAEIARKAAKARWG